jgi:transcriptional regulator with XRE-family HTH domain
MDATTRCRKVFGDRLRELRRKRGKTQAAISELAGLHRHYVSDIERGAHNPCLETIAKLAWALRVSPSDLFRDFTVAELDSMFGD